MKPAFARLLTSFFRKCYPIQVTGSETDLKNNPSSKVFPQGLFIVRESEKTIQNLADKPAHFVNR